ncbi:MAG: hypothetical protein Q8P01_00700 [bacterium]|nr:hypothetical protein [bacterium]
MFEKAKKLISLWTGRQTEWRLVYKAALWFGSLLLVYIAGFRLWAVGVFLAIAVFMYARSSAEKKSFRGSFLVLIAVNLMFLERLSAWKTGMLLEFAGILGLTALFFVYAGLSNLLFRERIKIHEGGSMLLVFLLGVSGAHLLKLETFWLFNLLLVSATTLLIMEHLEAEGIRRKKSALQGLGSALVMGETAWFLAFLPLHPLSLSAFLVLLFLALKTALIAYKRGELGTQTSLKQGFVYVSIALLIFMSGSWGA